MSSRTFIKHCTDFRTKRDPFVNSHCVTLNYRQLSKCSSSASSFSCVLWWCYWMVVITGKRRVVDKQIVQVLQWLPLLVGLADPCPPPPPPTLTPTTEQPTNVHREEEQQYPIYLVTGRAPRADWEELGAWQWNIYWLLSKLFPSYITHGYTACSVENDSRRPPTTTSHRTRTGELLEPHHHRRL